MSAATGVVVETRSRAGGILSVTVELQTRIEIIWGLREEMDAKGKIRTAFRLSF